MESSEAAAVMAAARNRARALVAGDRETLTALRHPALRWTTHAGAVLDRDRYVAGMMLSDCGPHPRRWPPFPQMAPIELRDILGDLRAHRPVPLTSSTGVSRMIGVTRSVFFS